MILRLKKNKEDIKMSKYANLFSEEVVNNMGAIVEEQIKPDEWLPKEMEDEFTDLLKSLSEIFK